jgi:chitodextrinase
LVLAGAVLTAGACTMQQQEPPEFTGPSEFAQSLTVSASPDVLVQDGASQSVITVTAIGPSGAPLANLPLRAEILVNGVRTDFGALSARSLVTDANGRATVVFTAPAGVSGAFAEATNVSIGITPLANDFGNSVTRFATLRLVPAGVVIPPANLNVLILPDPESPLDNESVLFRSTVCGPSTGQDACPRPLSSVISYAWDFGDGATATGETATHSYDSPGTYVVRLTVTDAIGRSTTATRSVTVRQGAGPEAIFNFSPTTPFTGDNVFFNATAAKPAAGRRIVSYRWVFGDGTTGNSGPTTSHVYTNAGTYRVTLTVTDDAGRSTTSDAQTVAVTPRP